MSSDHSVSSGAGPLTETPPEAEARQPALSLRSALLGLAALTMGSLWIRQTSLLSFTILVGEGVPAIPALFTLVLMTALGYAWHRLTRTGQWRREALLIYAFLSCALVTIDANGVRQLLAQITSLRYFAMPGNDYQSFADQLPSWLMPASDEAIRGFYEGVEGGAIPWTAWQGPLAVWVLAFMAFSLSLICLVSIFRKPWAEEERLQFPLAELALSIAPEPAENRGERQLLKNPLFWVGVGLAAIYNGSNIAHAFNPSVAAIGQTYDLNRLLTERPWTALRPLTLTYRPEIIGLGYLVPVDVLLSVWSFFLTLRLENFGAETMGITLSGFPYDRAQGLGAYVGLALFVLYTGRGHLRRLLQAALGGPPMPNDGEETLPSRVAFWGLVGGSIALVTFYTLAGMSLGMAVSYMLLGYLAALVYARVRVQTGLPVTYVVPREDITLTVLALKGTSGHLSRAEVRSETAFAVVSAFSRMTFAQLGAFELESLRIGERARIRRSHLLTAIAGGLLAGVLVGLYIHLRDSYHIGWNILDGGTTEGGYRTRQALSQYDRLQTRVFNRTPIEVNSNVARAVGLVVTLVMVWLRARFLRFPLNPLGLALAGTYGHSIWFPIFMAWLSKTIILRLGGPQTFRFVAPVFIGLALGQFFIAGGIWGLVGAFNEEVAKRYLVWFA